jgi:tetratricopeptide (TPR) repeat protein
VLADLENRTGDAAFDNVLKQALALALGQSPFINVLSDRTVNETLRALGHAPASPLTEKVARELCRRTGSRAVLGGDIADQRGGYLIELIAVECTTGKRLAKAVAAAEGRDQVLRALSNAAAALRLGLGESQSSLRQFDVPLEAATASIEALKNYGVGVATRREKGDGPSIPFFKRAVELDPGFPLTYAELTAIYRNQRQPTLALDCARKAYQLRTHVGERERLKITGIYLLATGDLESEIDNYRQWQSRYPRDFVPYNNLGNDYAQMGQLEKALPQYIQALKLAPSVISYVNVVGINVGLNRFDAASRTLAEAFANKLDGTYLRQNAYWLAFLQGSESQMQRQLAWASGKAGEEDALLSMQSDTEAYHGRLVRAQEYTKRAIDAAVRANSAETAGLWQVNAALRSAEIGETVSAKQAAAAALTLSSGRDVKLIAAFTLARCGDNRGAQALTEELDREYPNDKLMHLYWLSTINAALDLNNGNLSKALQELKIAAPYELGGAGTFVNYLYPAYLRGQVYLQMHRAEPAVSEFQKLLDHPGIGLNFVTAALAHRELGRAYASGGDLARAKAAYQEFFKIWKAADAENPVLRQATVEFAALH